MRQNDIEKIIAYQKCFIGPLVWKCFTNNFELLLSEKEFPTFCTFFMYINVHGHQIFAKCTLNECTKMELDPPHVCMCVCMCVCTCMYVCMCVCMYVHDKVISCRC